MLYKDYEAISRSPRERKTADVPHRQEFMQCLQKSLQILNENRRD
jgi:hypothetical protein